MAVACYSGRMDAGELEAEFDDILRELLRSPGMLAAALTRNAGGEAAGAPATAEGSVPPALLDLEPDGPIESMRLAGDWILWLATSGDRSPDLAQAIGRAQRALKSSLRRHTGEEVPELVRGGAAPRGRARIVERIERYLTAFLNVHGAAAAFLLRRAGVAAVAGDASEARRERLSFLRKRIDAEAGRRRGTSHAEVTGEDVFAMSFWFDAYLVVFFDHPYSIDFVRFRARNVARDLAILLPHLDDDPLPPANVHPLPPRT
jgi:hypothetical protein